MIFFTRFHPFFPMTKFWMIKIPEESFPAARKFCIIFSIFLCLIVTFSSQSKISHQKTGEIDIRYLSDVSFIFHWLTILPKASSSRRLICHMRSNHASLLIYRANPNPKCYFGLLWGSFYRKGSLFYFKLLAWIAHPF